MTDYDLVFVNITKCKLNFKRIRSFLNGTPKNGNRKRYSWERITNNSCSLFLYTSNIMFGQALCTVQSMGRRHSLGFSFQKSRLGKYR